MLLIGRGIDPIELKCDIRIAAALHRKEGHHVRCEPADDLIELLEQIEKTRREVVANYVPPSGGVN